MARTRFLYCFQSQARKIRAQMVRTAALETMAEMMGVLARWLFLYVHFYFFLVGEDMCFGREKSTKVCEHVCF